nr:MULTISPECIES: copper resistance protein CopC [unclassified Brevibacterium]
MPLALLLAAAFAVCGMFFAPAASAHDQLVSSDPENGATLKTAPEYLTLNFSGKIQKTGTEVKVMHEGKDVSAGEITIEDGKLMSALPDDLSTGDYKVLWRVVSADGHPVSGTIDFTVKGDGEAGGSAKQGTSEAEESAGAAAPADEQTPAALGGNELSGGVDQENTGSGISTGTGVLIGIGAGAVLGIVIALLIRKFKGLNQDK